MICTQYAGLDYWVYGPKTPRKGLPLVVFLHGIGERGPGPDKVFKISLPKWLKEGRWAPDAWVICPQCPAGVAWNCQVEKLKAVLDKEIEELGADKDRVSITGLSLGGFGTWAMGIEYPELFSAMAPVCGGGYPGRCDRLVNIPIWAFHGELDDIVPLRCSLQMVDAVNRAGGNAKLAVFHTLKHNAWDEAYGFTKVLDWLLEQKRVKS